MTTRANKEQAVAELLPYKHALEQIAFHEPQDDERAEAMRQIARRALGLDFNV